MTFSAPPHGIPDVFTDLAILPAHMSGRHSARSRFAPPHGTRRPTGNGPFRFVSHTPNRRWVFAANREFPAALGGPPRIDRLVIAVVDEPTTKLAALTAGELDFAGIQPAHASFVRTGSPARRHRVSPALHLRAGVQHPASAVQRCRRAPRDLARHRPAGDRQWLPVRVRHGGKPSGTARFSPRTGPCHRETADRRTSGTLRNADRWQRRGGSRADAADVNSRRSACTQRSGSSNSRPSSIVSRDPAHDFDAAVMGISGDLGLGQLAPLLTTTGLAHTSDRAAMLRLFADSTPVAFLYHAGGVQGMNRRVRGVQHGPAGRTGDASRMGRRPVTGPVPPIRTSAPVRLDFAGAWTDVAPFATSERGVVVNAAIDLRSHVELHVHQPRYELWARDLGERATAEHPDQFRRDGHLELLKAAIRFAKPGPCHTQYIRRGAARIGAGHLRCTRRRPDSRDGSRHGVRCVPRRKPPTPHGPLETVDAAVAGGKQDQFAAAMGGFQYLVFDHGRSTVRTVGGGPGICGGTRTAHAGVLHRSIPVLRRRDHPRHEGLRRKRTHECPVPCERWRISARRWPPRLVRCDLTGIGRLLGANWAEQQQLDSAMCTGEMKRLETAMLAAGAAGGKAAGAGAGGSMFFVVPGRHEQRDPCGPAMRRRVAAGALGDSGRVSGLAACRG